MPGAGATSRRLTVAPGQERFVAAPTYYLALCAYGDVWHPLSVHARRRGRRLPHVGHRRRRRQLLARWASSSTRRTRVGRRAGGGGRGAADRCGRRPATRGSRCRTTPRTSWRRRLYASLGFVETGEVDDDEVVARRRRPDDGRSSGVAGWCDASAPERTRSAHAAQHHLVRVRRPLAGAGLRPGRSGLLHPDHHDPPRRRVVPDGALRPVAVRAGRRAQGGRRCGRRGAQRRVDRPGRLVAGPDARRHRGRPGDHDHRHPAGHRQPEDGADLAGALRQADRAHRLPAPGQRPLHSL